MSGPPSNRVPYDVTFPVGAVRLAWEAPDDAPRVVSQPEAGRIKMAAIAAGGLLGAYCASVYPFSNSGPVTCPLRAVTGIPCPVCGTTRGVVALFNSDFAQAWHFNPLSYLVVGLGGLFGLLSLFGILDRGMAFGRAQVLLKTLTRQLTAKPQLVFGALAVLWVNQLVFLGVGRN